LLAVLCGSGAFASEANTKTLTCTTKSRDFIKGYALDESGKKISVTLCDGSIASIDEMFLPKDTVEDDGESLKTPVISRDQKVLVIPFQQHVSASYPMTTNLVLFRNGKTYGIAPDSGVIWDWHFSSKEKTIVLESGFPHGMSDPNIDEYAIETGKKLRHIKDGK